MQDVRKMLMEFGLGSMTAQLATQSVFFRPRTTDPDAQVTIALVHGVQRGLNALGADLALTGYLDVPTVAALQKVSGMDWHGKRWADIFADLQLAKKIGKSLAPQAAMGGFDLLPGFFSDPLFILAAAAVAGFYIWRKTAAPAGAERERQ